MGSISATTKVCSDQATSLGLSCSATPMMISYSGAAIDTFPRMYSFSNDLPIYSMDGNEIAVSWTEALYGKGLKMSLIDSGVLSSVPSCNYFTGSINLARSTNCNDWTSASSLATAYSGMANTKGRPNWFRFYPLKCNVESQRMCLCVKN